MIGTSIESWWIGAPFLLLVSSTSLLPLLIPARDVRGLPGRLVALVEARLKRCGIDERTIAAETRAMDSVVIGPTVDRSVLGIMVDFAKAVPYHLEPGRWSEASLRIVEDSVPFGALIRPCDIPREEGAAGSACEMASEHATGAGEECVDHRALVDAYSRLPRRCSIGTE